MPDRHALLGPSGATRWLACSASARMEETLPNRETIYSKMGHVAHELAEIKLQHNLIKPMTKRAYNARLKALQAATFNGQPAWTEDMDDATDVYLESVKAAAAALGPDYFIAVEIEVDLAAYIPESFGTADCILIGPDVLHVIDYKNGTGVAVASEDNTQMKLYALGAVLKYQDLFNIEHVRMTIVQPNISRHPETAEITKAELLAWAETIKAPALAAWQGVDIKTPGDHCRFCRAQARCPAFKAKLLELEGFKAQAPTPDMLTDAEAGELLVKAKDVIAWAKKLEEYITAQLQAGVPIPGWKLVHGRSNRSFTDLAAAFEAARKAGIADALLYERKPVTLAALEKIMGPADFAQALGSYVSKPPGAPTLAPASDKRPAYSKLDDAVADFGENLAD